MAKIRSFTELEKHLMEENKMLREEIKTFYEIDTVTLDIRTYNELLIKAQKYIEQINKTSIASRMTKQSFKNKFNKGRE